jgi:hypothetical protein
MGWDFHAAPRGIIVPAMIGTDQAVIVDLAAGKSCATMDAQIPPRAKGVGRIVPPEHKVLSEEPWGQDLPCSSIQRSGHHVPIVQ